MLRFFIELWPLLVPLTVYLLWHARRVRRCRRLGECPPRMREGPWSWVLISTLIIAIVLMLVKIVFDTQEKGTYTPPHLENGRVVPGKIER